MEQDEYLTVEEVAAQLRVGPETVRRWLREGKLRGHNFSGKIGYRIQRRDWEAFVTERYRDAAHVPTAPRAGGLS